MVRGVAAATVFLTHLGNPFPRASLPGAIASTYHQFFRTFVWCNGGLHASVVVFVVLSGFCIHMPLAQGPSRLARGYWSRHLKKRFIRIYPVLVVAAALGLVTHSLLHGWRPQYMLNFALNLTGLAAFMPISPEGPLGNGILLTVIVLCVLYLSYPAMTALKAWRGWNAVVGLALAFYAANMALLMLVPGEAVWFQRNFHAFLLYWIIGILAAEFSTRPVAPWRSDSSLAVLVFYVFYLAVCHSIHFRGSHYFKSVLLALVTAHLLSFLYRRERWRPFGGRAMHSLSRVGEMSYSLYAAHMPVLGAIALVLSGTPSIRRGVLIYTLSVGVVSALAMAIYRFVEVPCHRYARRLSASEPTLTGNLYGIVRT